MVALTREEAIAERLAQVFAPALFADGLGAILAAELLLRDLDRDHPRRAAVAWRYLELRLTLDPTGVLAQIDAGGPPADDDGRHRWVPAAAMIACGELVRATAALVTAPDVPMVATLRGQLALASGDRDGAERHLAAARATATAPEDRAAALLWSVEAASRRGDRDAVVAHAATLDELLVAHNAATSQQMLALQAAVAQLPDRGEVLIPLFARHVDDAKAALCSGVPEEQAQLGPIPRHVHAAYRKLRGQPAALEAALMNIAGLQVRADQHGEALATITYAARLAPRLLPAAAAARWAEALELFRAQLGDERRRALDEYLRVREETFLAAMRAS